MPRVRKFQCAIAGFEYDGDSVRTREWPTACEENGTQSYNHMELDSADTETPESVSSPGPPMRDQPSGRPGFSPGRPETETPAEPSLTPGPRRREIINGCCLKPPSVWSLVTQQQKTNSAGYHPLALLNG